MIILQFCKMQILCLLVLFYVGYIFVRECRDLNKITGNSASNRFFDIMFLFVLLAVLFDGITACTVNFTEQIPREWNLALHLGMFLSYDVFAVLLFLYWLSVTIGIPKRTWVKVACVLPGVLAIGLTICFLPELDFIQGTYTNYSMGKSVYAGGIPGISGDSYGDHNHYDQHLPEYGESNDPWSGALPA